MSKMLYRVDPRMIPPVSLSMVLGAALVLWEGASTHGILMLAILSPFFYLGAEILTRTIILDEWGIRVKKFLRSSETAWKDVDNLETVRSGSKFFLIIQPSSHKAIIVTNTIQPFQELTANILKYLPPNAVSESTSQALSSLPSKYGPVAQAWLVTLVLAAIAAGKFLGFGQQ
jgi:hypothetical protein